MENFNFLTDKAALPLLTETIKVLIFDFMIFVYN